MGATYLSLQVRTTDRDAAVAALREMILAAPASGLQFKIAAGRKRTGKERDKIAAKLEALADVCDTESRARLVAVLADATGVIYSSELLRAFCEIAGIRSAFTSFDYLQHGERDGLEPGTEPTLVSS